MAKHLLDLLGDESGATAIEYSLIIALASAAGISAFHAFGDSLASIFSPLSNDLGSVADDIEPDGKDVVLGPMLQKMKQ